MDYHLAMLEDAAKNDRETQIEERISNHFSGLLQRFEKVAVKYQRLNLLIRLLQTLIAGLLPFLIEIAAPKTLLVLLSMTLAILVMASQLWQFDSKWRQYRLITFELRRELYMFLDHAGEYSSEDTASRVQAFSRRTETLLNSEFSPWMVINHSERVS